MFSNRGIDTPLGDESDTQRSIMGTFAATGENADDQYGDRGLFFIFPDLHVRYAGEYRLQFKLFNIGAMISRFPKPNSDRSLAVASCWTQVFTVYSPKMFVGMGGCLD